MNLIGWFGSICFALCGMPQAFKCIKQGHSEGISNLFLILWLGGEICYIVATLHEFGFISWLLVNYILNIIWISIIGYYKWRQVTLKLK